MRTKTNSKLLNLYSGLSKKFNGILGVALALAIVFSSFTFAIPMVANADGTPTPTVYVDDTGNDETADGSSDKPFLTLNSAIAKIKEGSNSGTVIVKNYLTIPASGFTWDNHSGVDVTITGGIIDASARSSLYIKDNVTFKDVTVKWPTQNDKRVYAMGYKLVIESDVIFDGVIGEIYGGVENATVKSTNLTLCGGTYDYIFGGSRTGSTSTKRGSVSGNTNVLIDGNVVAKYLCAGGCDSTVDGNTNLTVKAGSFNYIFGGGYALTRKGDIDPEVKGNTNILIDGNVNQDHSYTSDSNQPAIYGGSKCGTVGGDTNITVKSGNFGFVFGGGADDKDTTPLSTVKGASNIDFSGNAYCIYGGAKYAKGGSSNITVRDNANVYQIFGGSENNSAEGNISINILGGTVYRRIYGGSYNSYGITGWADTNNHVTGNIGITVMPTANLQLNCDDDNSFYALSRGNSAFDDEYGALVLNDTYYSQISSKVGPKNVVTGDWSTKAYHYLVTTNGNLADGSMGNVLCENNSLKITPATGYLATVKFDGQEDVTFERAGTYDLPAINKDETKNIIVTFSLKPQPEEIAVFQNGDVNMDKYVDILDLVKTKKALAYEDTDALMDIVNDQNINADDISALKQILLSDNSSNYSEFNTYDDLATAVTDVNADGGFIVVKKDISMSSTIKLTSSLKNIRIINEPGKDVTITRDGDFEMFNVSNTGYSLTLGSNNATGSLTIVASTENNTTKRVVDNSGKFTLAKNATIKNANGSTWGNVLINRSGEAHLYGNIVDNTTAYNTGVILQNTAGGKIVFHEGNYTNNSATNATSYAGLFYINAGEVEIKGGAFSGNTAKTKCELGNVKSGATLTITGGTFDENQSINVDGTAYIGGSANSFNLVKGAGSIIVNDSLSDSKIKITANDCASGTTILTKADSLDSDVFADVCQKAVVSSNGLRCALDKDGKIVYLDTITIDEIPNSNYDSLASAVAAAKELTSATVRIGGVVSIDTTLTISNDITITNAVGKDAVIKRSADILMFNVSTTGKLTLGSDDTTGSLTIDAATSKAATKRVVDNYGTFILGKNATIKNANSAVWGNVLINRNGEAHLYGNITGNTNTSGACGAILQNNAGKVVFHEGNYSNNKNTVTSGSNYGGLFYVNDGSVEILGGNFSGNMANANGIVGTVKEGKSITISGGIFADNQCISVNGTANISGTVVGANLIKGTGTLTVNGQLTNSSITITPNDYTVGTIVLTKAEGVDDGVFADVCSQVLVTPNSLDNFTYIVDENGALKQYKFTIDGSDAEYDTLADAVTAANKLTSATIRVNGIASLSAGLTISKDITITNVVGKNAVIKRSLDILMFKVSTTSSKLTLGSDDTTGSLTIDAATAAAASKRVVDNYGTFVLGKNATIKNANSTVWGNVLINRNGEAHLYGNIINNTCSGACGPILQNDAGKVIFHEGNYSNNSATRVKNADTDSSLAGLVYVNKGTVEIVGGTFGGNTSTGYGNLAYVKKGASLTISGGTIDADQNVYRES